MTTEPVGKHFTEGQKTDYSKMRLNAPPNRTDPPPYRQMEAAINTPIEDTVALSSNSGQTGQTNPGKRIHDFMYSITPAGILEKVSGREAGVFVRYNPLANPAAPLTLVNDFMNGTVPKHIA